MVNLFHLDDDSMHALLTKFLAWRATQEASLVSMCAPSPQIARALFNGWLRYAPYRAAPACLGLLQS